MRGAEVFSGEINEYANSLLRGGMKDYQLEQSAFERLVSAGTRQEEAGRTAADIIAPAARHAFYKARTGVDFGTVNEGSCSNYHGIRNGRVITQIEGYIGGHNSGIGIPSNPIVINGRHVDGEAVWIPVETHETALIAGLNRGIGLLNNGYCFVRKADGTKEKRKGVRTEISSDWMTRASGVYVDDLDTAVEVASWINDPENFRAISEVYGSVSKGGHSKLVKVRAFHSNNIVYYKTYGTHGEAMGMNHATKGNRLIYDRVLSKQFPDVFYAGASLNLCTDKKDTMINMLEGRGLRIYAEVFIPPEALKNLAKGKIPDDVLAKTDIARKVEIFNAEKNWIGSAKAGSLTGFNTNVNNTISAFMAASGDDVAQSKESSGGYVYARALDDGTLRFSLELPALEVATVGGGTGNPVVRKFLDFMGCNKTLETEPRYFDGWNRRRKGEIFAAGAMALEANTLIALGVLQDLEESHMRMTGKN